MNISITPELKAYIDGKVASGGYGNASEVIREALRRLKDEEETRARWREQIQRGWDQAQRGELVDGPTSMAEGRAKLEALIAAKARKASA